MPYVCWRRLSSSVRASCGLAVVGLAGDPHTLWAGPYAAAANEPPTGLLLAAALRRLDCAAASSSVMVSAAAPRTPPVVSASVWQLAQPGCCAGAPGPRHRAGAVMYYSSWYVSARPQDGA